MVATFHKINFNYGCNHTAVTVLLQSYGRNCFMKLAIGLLSKSTESCFYLGTKTAINFDLGTTICRYSGARTPDVC